MKIPKIKTVHVPFVVPHKDGMPDLNKVVFTQDVYSDFYYANNVDYTFQTFIGLLECKVLFCLTRREV